MNDTLNISALLAEQVNRLFEKSVNRDMLVRAEAGTLPKELWDELENIGVTMALVTEEAGGSALSWSDVEGVWHSIGYHTAPTPLGETMIGRHLLSIVGLEIPEGPLAVASDLLSFDNGKVSGENVFVPWADQVEHIVAVAGQGANLHLCLLRRSDVQGKSLPSISRIPCSRLNLAAAVPLATAPLPATTDGLGLLPYLAALRASQTSGCLDRLLDLCVEYGNTRVQFGKPLGKFQAMQHMIATLAEQAAAARVAGAMGCRGLDAGDREFAVAAAKIQTGQSASAGAAIAHQVFGAMGVTDEHTLHFFTRRLWQWRDEGESEHWWAERLGRRVINAGGAALWPSLVDA